MCRGQLCAHGVAHRPRDDNLPLQANRTSRAQRYDKVSVHPPSKRRDVYDRHFPKVNSAIDYPHAAAEYPLSWLPNAGGTSARLRNLSMLGLAKLLPQILFRGTTPNGKTPASGSPAQPEFDLPDGPAAKERQRLKRFFAARLPFEEHVRELAELRLINKPHLASHLAGAMQEVHDIHLSFRQLPLPLRDGGSTPETLQYHGDDRYTVWLPPGLSWWYREYVSFHAIAHVAAGHLLAERDPISGEIAALRAPDRKRLAREVPLTPDSDPALFPPGYSPGSTSDLLLLYEVEADLRTRYCMRTAQLGAAALEIDRLNQLT